MSGTEIEKIFPLLKKGFSKSGLAGGQVFYHIAAFMVFLFLCLE